MSSKRIQLQDVEWDSFHRMSVQEQGQLLQQAERPYNILLAQQFNRPMLDRICQVATGIRRIAKSRGGNRFLRELLSEKRAMLYFSQPSTRTFLSFYAACQILGVNTAEVRNPNTSSELKGESPEDSVRTFSSYFDMIIMRHQVGGFANRIAWMLAQTERPVPLINAGSGKDQHPTQALLDIYTLERSFEHQGGVEGKTVAFVGDLARGRTVRSLAWLLTCYPGVKQVFCAPEDLQISQDVLNLLDGVGMQYEVTDDFDAVVESTDALYMTRIQDEWDVAGESKDIDTTRFHFQPRHLEMLPKDSVIMHPLPRREEIALEVDHDPRAVYWRQVRNGMWIRAALMLMIFNRDAEIERYYDDFVR